MFRETELTWWVVRDSGMKTLIFFSQFLLVVVFSFSFFSFSFSLPSFFTGSLSFFSPETLLEREQREKKERKKEG